MPDKEHAACHCMQLIVSTFTICIISIQHIQNCMMSKIDCHIRPILPSLDGWMRWILEMNSRRRRSLFGVSVHSGVVYRRAFMCIPSIHKMRPYTSVHCIHGTCLIMRLLQQTNKQKIGRKSFGAERHMFRCADVFLRNVSSNWLHSATQALLISSLSKLKMIRMRKYVATEKLSFSIQRNGD